MGSPSSPKGVWMWESCLPKCIKCEALCDKSSNVSTSHTTKEKLPPSLLQDRKHRLDSPKGPHTFLCPQHQENTATLIFRPLNFQNRVCAIRTLLFCYLLQRVPRECTRAWVHTNKRELYSTVSSRCGLLREYMFSCRITVRAWFQNCKISH